MRKLILTVALAFMSACTPGANDGDGVNQIDREVVEDIVSEFGDVDDDGIALRDALVNIGLLELADSGNSMSGQKPPPAPIVGSPAVDNDGDGMTERQGDCDDANADIYRGAPESCDGDGVDHDCDQEFAPGNDPNPRDGYLLGVDLDQDGVADPRTRMQGCGTTAVSQWVVPLTQRFQDCDDRTQAVRPYKAELLDGIDNNCDGTLQGGGLASMIDEHVGEIPCFTDNDFDGYGSAWGTWAVGPYCPLGLVQNKRDCDDSEPLRAPGRLELCNGIDDDCDSFVDNAQAPSQVPALDRFRNRGTGVYENSWYSVCIMDRLGYDHR